MIHRTYRTEIIDNLDTPDFDYPITRVIYWGLDDNGEDMPVNMYDCGDLGVLIDMVSQDLQFCREYGHTGAVQTLENTLDSLHNLFSE